MNVKRAVLRLFSTDVRVNITVICTELSLQSSEFSRMRKKITGRPFVCQFLNKIPFDCSSYAERFLK